MDYPKLNIICRDNINEENLPGLQSIITIDAKYITFSNLLDIVISNCGFDAVANRLLDIEHDRHVEDRYCVHGNYKNYCEICNNFNDDMA